jgi:glycosyltransferase involved in cell wall biosynthesis
MDVSVVIPTRNRPELLALTLRSVLWQEAVVIEVVVVDDNGDSDTQAVSGARNCGITAAKGDWVSFLDDDDLWAPGKLAAQLAVAKKTGAGWVYTGNVTVDEELSVRSGAPPPPPAKVVAELRRHNSVPAGASNVVVRRDVLETVGGFDPELRTSEDWDLWLRLAAIGLPACVPRPLVALRTHARMASLAVDRMLGDIEVIARRHGIPVDRARHRRWAAWTCLESGHRSAALYYYGRAAAHGDVASLGRAVVALLYPRVVRHHGSVADDEWAREAQTWLQSLRLKAEGILETRAPQVR